MKFKDDVIITGLQLQMRKVLIVADKIWKEHGQELVVTSALDGTHSAGSLHYYGYALDFRSRYFSEEDKIIVSNKLRKRLGSDYDIIVHKTHIHVEYNRILEGK